MKTCRGCKEEKSLDQFRNRKSSPDGKESRCKACRRSYDNGTYAADSERRAAVRKSALGRCRVGQQYIRDYLSTHPCVDCGLEDPDLLEFDHVRGEKTAGVGYLARRGFALDVIQDEILKCDVRCLHCHRKRTISQFGWYASLV